MSNLNPHDDLEVRCQLVDEPDMVALAKAALVTGDTRIAYVHGEPAMFFGTTTMTVCCMSAWAVGTASSWRAIPAVSRCFIGALVPDRLEEGFNSMEARAMIGNDAATRWIERIGGEAVGEPFLYGKNGEPFQLFRWTVASYRIIRQKRWGRAYVPGK